jgi:hypothetical protein
MQVMVIGNGLATRVQRTDCTYVASSSSFVCYQELEVLGYEGRSYLLYSYTPKCTLHRVPTTQVEEDSNCISYYWQLL